MGGCLSKNFENSKHKNSDGHDHLPSTSGDLSSENENEDIDRAITLSLVEENKNGNNVDDCNSQLEYEQLARDIEESLNLESPPRICAGCNTEIHGRYLSCLNASWHPECFRCRACNLPIPDFVFSTSEGYPHHILCLKKIHHPKCDVCKRKIPTNPATGQVNYGTHQFWNQKFCPSRIDDGTPRCCSCEPLEPQEAGYVDLGDGRKLCLECLHYAILDTNECQPLYMDIQKFYEGLDMKLDEQIPLFLVERQALNKARAGEKNGQHDMLEIETRGVCLSEELTISTISKKPGLGTRNRTVDMRTQPHKLTRHCEVTAILILYGLPRLLTGSILAHEMMRAWFRLHGYRKLNRVVEKGMCQVLAHMWLEHELSSSASGSNFVSASSSPSSNEFERMFGKFCKNIIESDITPFYGDGFRAAQNAVRKNGLQKTLHHIRMTRNLPI